MSAFGLAAACMLVPLLGWPLVRLVAPRHARGGFGAVLAVFVGLGAASWIYTPLRLADVASLPVLLGTEVGLVAALWVAAIRWRPRGPAAVPPPPPRAALRPLTVLLGLAAGGIVAIAAAVWLRLRTHEADGGFDALAIWNYRARFMFRADDLSPAFGPLTGHPDYPLQLPTTVARLYTYAGDDPNLIPQAVALLFGMIAMGLLTTGLARLRTLGAALLGVALLLSLRGFLFLTANHYADVPLSCALLATVLLLTAATRETAAAERDALRSVALAGVCAGIGAWTKNEGQLFAAAALVCVALFLGGSWRLRARAAGAFVLGLAPSLACLLLFKAMYPNTVDLIAQNGPSALVERAFNPARHAAVFAAVRQQWFLLIDPLLLILVAAVAACFGQDRAAARSVLPAAALLATIATGFYLIYVTTPFDPAAHISGSLGRLLVQLWPPAVATLLLCLRAPEAAIEAAWSRHSATAR